MPNDPSHDPRSDQQAPQLRRAVTLPMLILYGLGVTIGAGIYVLVGATAAQAGMFAPSAFVLSALVMAFSAASFTEFVGRIPRSAGQAAYVRTGFRRKWLTMATGGLVIIGAGLIKDPSMLGEIGSAIPAISDGAGMLAVLSAGLIAFFAFIGFVIPIIGAATCFLLLVSPLLTS